MPQSWGHVWQFSEGSHTPFGHSGQAPQSFGHVAHVSLPWQLSSPQITGNPLEVDAIEEETAVDALTRPPSPPAPPPPLDPVVEAPPAPAVPVALELGPVELVEASVDELVELLGLAPP